MRAVAERLVIALSAATEADYRASGQIVFVPIGIEDLNLPFYLQWSIVVYRDFRCHRFILLNLDVWWQSHYY